MSKQQADMTDFKGDEGLRYLLIKLMKSHCYFVVQFNLLTLRLLNDDRIAATTFGVTNN